MPHIVFTLIICLFSFSIFCQDLYSKTEQIEVHLTFSKPCEGLIHISCFQYEETFLDAEAAVFSKILECQDSIVISGLDPDLPRSLIAYLDVNRNRKLDLNFFGVPTEPYAISNGFSGKWREPRFKDALEPSTSKSMQLDFLYWKER